MELWLTLALLIVLMVVLIFLSGWFSGSETAITNLNTHQIAEMKRRKEKNVDYIIKLKKDMDRTLVTILIGNNIVNIVLSSVAALMANTLFGGIGVSIMVGVITFLIIVFGEITPKSNAVNNSEKIAKRISKVIYFLSIALYPIIWVLLIISRQIIKLFGGARERAELFVTDDTIKSLATMSMEEGLIKKIERDIIHHVFAFGDRKIGDVMVPMKDVFKFDRDHDVNEASDIVANGGFTRVPLVTKKKVQGLIYTKDLVEKTKGTIKPLMRKPFFVKKGSDITEVFKEMQKKKVHMAIVKDDLGAHVGIVTLEDIMEELVGEIYDEYFEIKYKKKPKNN